MSNYTIQANWAGKDDLTDSDPDKIISGDEFNTEFLAIQTAVNTKAELNGSSLENFSASTVTATNGRTSFATANDGTFNLNSAQNFSCTPVADITFTFSNIPNGQSGFIKLDNSGGHTISLHANTKADANAATKLSATGTYIVGYITDGTDSYLSYTLAIA